MNEKIESGIKIRGIYSTSLSKFLIDNGYKIANPSLRIKSRLNIEGVKYADTIIYDKEDKNGVVIHGKRDREILELFKKNFENISFREIIKGNIYVGEIKDVLTDKKVIVVELNEEGFFGYLPIKDYWGVIKRGEKVLVQIKGYKGVIPMLTTQIRIFGDDLIVIEKGYSKVSKHLTKKEEIERLHKIAEEYQIRGYGILWKALAENKPEEYLKKEIEELIKKLEELKRSYKDRDKGLVVEGQRVIFVDFDFTTKRKLDEIRNKVVNTIDYHHIIRKANIGPIVDFAERLFEFIDRKRIKEKMLETYWEHTLPNLNSRYTIIHRKANGKEIKIVGKILEKNFEERKIVIKRIVKKEGIYDGLNVKKEVGDIIITYLYEGAWFVKHEYYSKENKLKGIYYSINTPIEFYPKNALYLDLEIDVIEVNGERKIIDENKLDEIKGKYITDKLYEKAKEVARLLLNKEEEKCIQKDLL